MKELKEQRLKGGKIAQYPPYMKKLGLKWEVRYYLTQDDRARIWCRPEEKMHEVWLPKKKAFLPDVVHELCHGKLAEAIDPLFATAAFVKKYAELQGVAQQDLDQKLHQFSWSWAGIDIWVNDLRHKYWPNLTSQDHSAFIQGINEAGAEQLAVFEQYTPAIGLAMHMGEAKRHGLGSFGQYMELIMAFDQESRNLLIYLATLYERLPRLFFNKKVDLKAMEEMVKAAARALKFPITPRIIEEEGRNVWEL